MAINYIDYEFRKKDLIDCISYEFRKKDLTYAVDTLSEKSIFAFDSRKKTLSDDIRVAPFQLFVSGLTLSRFTVTYLVLVPIIAAIMFTLAPWPLSSTHLLVFVSLGLSFGSIGLALLFSNLIFVRILASWVVRRALNRGEIVPQYFGHHRLVMKENYLELQYEATCIQRYYTGIQKIVEYPKCSLLLCAPHHRIVVPHTAFVNDRQRSYFINRLQSKISQAKSDNISAYSIEENRESRFVVRFIWNEQSFINAMTKGRRLRFTTRLGWTAGTIICTLIGIAFSFRGITLLASLFGASNNFQLLFIASIVSLFIGFIFLSTLIVPFTPWLKKAFKTQIDNGIISHDFIGPQEICFKDDRIRELRHMSSADLMYDSIFCVKQDSSNVYILPKKTQVVPIPNSAFSNDYQKQELINFIEYKIRQK